MKFWFPFLSVASFCVTLSGAFATSHSSQIKEEKERNYERRIRWASHCECGCDCEDCDFFSIG